MDHPARVCFPGVSEPHGVFVVAQCPGCEMLPPPPPTEGTLFVWPPLGHTAGKLEASLVGDGIEVGEPAPNCLSARITPALLELARDRWTQALSAAELDDCKCLTLPEGRLPSLGDLAQVVSLSTFIGKLSGHWLTEMLSEGRLTTHFQPIVSTVEPTEIFAHECLVRGLDRQGKLVNPGALYKAAREGKILFHLDRAARLQHIRAARQHGLETSIFINFNPTSIYDPAFCLKTTVAAIGNSGISPDRFVFEVVESDEVADPDRLPRILDYYRNAGFRVALDDLGAGYSSLNMLSRLKPDFVKLDMELIRGIDRDPYKASIVSKLLEVARGVEVKTIVEGIETEGEWQWSAENGADYCQGYFFAKPAPAPHQAIELKALAV
jgi:EAL domain-containing protein (putative c-di-GMP-specific phosphodiesterase class I)